MDAMGTVEFRLAQQKQQKQNSECFFKRNLVLIDINCTYTV